MKRITLIIIITILLSLMLIQTGCSIEYQGRTEMSRIEFIRAVGLDKSPINEDKVRLTIATQSVQTDGGGGQEKKSELLYSEGNTVFEAVRNFWNYMDKRPFWGHLEYILIGEEAAREGINKYLDFFCRDPEVRLNLKVYVTRDLSAEQVIRKSNHEEKFIFDRLEGIDKNQWGQSVFAVVDLMEVMYILDNEYLSLFIPCIELAKFTIAEKGKDEIVDLVMGGFAIFEEDKLVTHIGDKMGRGLNWLMNKIKSGVIIVESPEGNKISLEIIEANTKIKPLISNGKLSVKVNIQMSSNIDEITGFEDIFKESILLYLEARQEELIKEEVTSVINFAQEKQLDFFSIASEVYHKYPIRFEDNFSNSWKETFEGIDFIINVDSKINRTYDIKRPNATKVGE